MYKAEFGKNLLIKPQIQDQIIKAVFKQYQGIIIRPAFLHVNDFIQQLANLA